MVPPRRCGRHERGLRAQAPPRRRDARLGREQGRAHPADRGGQGGARGRGPRGGQKTTDGYLQGYNAQAAVDGTAQVIVATEVFAAQNDAPFLPEMLAQIRANTGRQAVELSADYGYLAESNLAACERRHVVPYIATGRLRHHDGRPSATRRWSPRSRIAAMERRLRRAGRRSRYRLRKQIVDPSSVRSRPRSASAASSCAAYAKSAANGAWLPPHTTSASSSPRPPPPDRTLSSATPQGAPAPEGWP